MGRAVNLRNPALWRLSVAPMMDCTDRHYRYFARLLSHNARLYSEMVVADALLHGDTARFLAFSTVEHPVALQLGGSEPAKLAEAAAIGADYGYDELNLNVGCPSDRVRAGRFGACLMAEPDLVARCIEAMKRRQARMPVTIKCRIGIDNDADYAGFVAFAKTMHSAGADALIVHARKALLSGLSPKQNRTIPPLRYDYVYGLKSLYADWPIILNGGVTHLSDAAGHLKYLDGVMIGRAAYHNPWLLQQADRLLFNQPTIANSREQVVAFYADYAAERLAAGDRPNHVLRPLLGLYTGAPGARAWRRRLTHAMQQPRRDAIDFLRRAPQSPLQRLAS